MTSRNILLAASLLTLAGCNAGPYPASVPTADEQRRLADFIGGRTAGPPTRCISAATGMQIRAIGDKIVAQWGGRRWVNEVQGSCREADSMNNILRTESNPVGQYCENETFRVISTSGGLTMGSCMLGPWTPYEKP